MAELSEHSDPISTLRPVLNEIVTEDRQRRCITRIAPTFWSNFNEDLSAGSALDALTVAVKQLNQGVLPSTATSGHTQCVPGPHPLSYEPGSIDDLLRLSLCLNIPPYFYNLVKKICTESIRCWSKISKTQDATDLEEEYTYWDKFKELTALLHSHHLFHFIADFAVSSVIDQQIKEQLSKECSQTYDIAILEEATHSITQHLLDWLQHVVKNSEAVLEEWESQLMCSSYEVFAKLRIAELFEIIVDYPDSEPALKDLAVCLECVEVKGLLISSLDKSFRKRLLHPGVNTADIITQYISAVKALRLLDPSGVVLEKVCSPVREYLHNRNDTVRCIVASLTNDCESELAEELIKGENDDDDEQDFDSWEPDPVDANPNVTSATRKSSDIISLLVNIYGSCEMFVSEYCNLLADRLLQMCSYDVSREVCTLELLKQRFGEASLHFCEVMLKDVGDSKRIHSAVSSAMLDNDMGDAKRLDNFELQGLILSSEFWPAFREESLEFPSSVQERIDIYSQEYGRLKGMRKLEWKANLGMVDVEIDCGEQRLSMAVSPIRAVLIYQFQFESVWSTESLSHVLKAQPSVVRKHAGFWVSQGLLKEHSTNIYSLVQEQTLACKGAICRIDYEDESVMEAEDTREAELQVYWNYIVHMLTNLGSLPLERIHSMLGMFGLQSNLKKPMGLSDLKLFLQEKAVEQKLVFNNGSYSLVQ